MTDIRVVLADDHPVVRAGLAALLSSLPGIEVVGVASNGREAVREVITSRPDVAVLDLQMPDLDGFAATRELARSAPDTAVLVLTMFEDDDSVFAAMRAGARGYLVKGAEQEEIARAIRAVAAGEAIFGPGVARRMLTFFSAPPAAAEPFPELTTRERQILDLIAAGLSNPAIGDRLDLASKTVANNVSTIFTKLGIADRATAIIQARNAGLGTDRVPKNG
ncbi:response regulator transcription factor [Kribbella kalugense]|uniref:LuxR family two component transcriptional regulator n=1 Tax=Kribbella kalugense TaxID=2512221 RepID=A0A4R7ZWI9_9ACTN|nr:response regulator transcription factor [Kribbella kalugense]TDW21258.1 LuxR family two component transcriptional regulator [Kribbella kalugense]